MSSARLPCPCLQPRRWLQLCLLAAAVLGVNHVWGAEVWTDYGHCPILSFQLDNPPVQPAGAAAAAHPVRVLEIVDGRSRVPRRGDQDALGAAISAVAADETKLMRLPGVGGGEHVDLPHAIFGWRVKRVLQHWKWEQEMSGCDFHTVYDVRGATHHITNSDLGAVNRQEMDIKNRIWRALTGANQQQGDKFTVILADGTRTGKHDTFTGVCALEFHLHGQKMFNYNNMLNDRHLSEFNCAAFNSQNALKYKAVPLDKGLKYAKALTGPDGLRAGQPQTDEYSQRRLMKAFDLKGPQIRLRSSKTIILNLLSPRRVFYSMRNYAAEQAEKKAKPAARTEALKRVFSTFKGKRAQNKNATKK